MFVYLTGTVRFIFAYPAFTSTSKTSVVKKKRDAPTC